MLAKRDQDLDARLYQLRGISKTTLSNLASALLSGRIIDGTWSTTRIHSSPYFHASTSARPVGMSLPRTAWVKLNRLRTGVGRFHSSMHKWGIAPSSNCQWGALEQTADHILITCPIHRASRVGRCLTVLDDETRCWLNNITSSI